jgi:uncharacterized protein YdaU (DUF1376 family)
MSEAPYMQLYVGDYRADTSTLTIEQHGAYLLLLMAMWSAGGSLPNDDGKLARSIGASRKQWLRIWPEIHRYFLVDGDSITQKRLLSERRKWSEKSIKRRDAGRRGGLAKSISGVQKSPANEQLNILPPETVGNAKALKTHEGDLANATANATILPQQNPTILHIPSPEEVDGDKSPSCTKPRRKRASYSTDLEAFWSSYPTDPLMSKKEAAAQWSKLTPEDRDRATKAVPAFAAHCRANPDYRPVHACRFLSQRRFEGFDAQNVVHFGRHGTEADDLLRKHQVTDEELAEIRRRQACQQP